MKQIPNLITLLNLFFGCMAIVFALQTDSVIIKLDEEYNSSFNIPEKLVWASLYIGIAALVDFLDGFVARWLGASSSMGKQLDSLSDVVSFGVAPSVILYQLLRLSFAREENGLDTSMGWLLPSFLIACAAAYRLAKFNLDESQQYNFKGVPTPAIGLLIASFPLILHFNAPFHWVKELFTNKWFLYSLIILLSWLMLSNLSIMGLKFSSYRLKDNMPKVVLAIISLLAALFLHWLAVPFIFISYLLISFIHKKNIA